MFMEIMAISIIGAVVLTVGILVAGFITVTTFRRLRRRYRRRSQN